MLLICSPANQLTSSRLLLTLLLLASCWLASGVHCWQGALDERGQPSAGAKRGQANNGQGDLLGNFLVKSSLVKEATTTSSSGGGWLTILQVPKDEFNTTENPIQFLPVNLADDDSHSHTVVAGLRRVLMRSSYKDCCASWANLTEDTEIQSAEANNRKKGKSSSLRASDLLNELKRISSNITYLSIDGQPGESEREKYYNFYDGVQYYLRLMRVARNYMDDSTFRGSSVEAEFNRSFWRQVKSIEHKVNQDPTLSSFLNELLDTSEPNLINREFEFYENFLGRTQFGQHYARNISIIRESVMVFDLICSQLTGINFPSNLTRPSKLYEIISRMSFQLYNIRNELVNKINPRIRNNRQDVRHVFSKLNDLTESRPYIRMLGDVFSSIPHNFGQNVKQLTHLLDLYTTNSLTEASFYEQLAELPEDFILLGSAIAHDYEVREVTHVNRFDSDYTNWNHLTYRYANDEPKSSSSDTNDARQTSNSFSILTRLFSGG